MCGYYKRMLLALLVILITAPVLPIAQAQDTAPALTFTSIVSGIARPVAITHAGDGSNRLFVLEQTGSVRIIQQGQRLDPPFLNISDKISCCGEQGLLGIAFPPDFKNKKYFYVNYTNRQDDTVIARYKVGRDPNRADANSEEILLTIPQPFKNHNGGQMAFGPDKFLYIATGDGGSANDPENNGQRLDTLLGKILRLDVESGRTPYAVPANNPLSKTPNARPEIWAYGLRNPWRFSFDRLTGDLYIADVGQELFEEINVQPANSKGGENYGWKKMEGAHCFMTPNCNQQGMVLPQAEYDHKQGCSVTGGYVYRGTKYPALTGIYFYADFCSGQMWGLRKAGTKWDNFPFPQVPYSVSTFGEDEAGELYMADYSGGVIYQVGTTTPPPANPPKPTTPPPPNDPAPPASTDPTPAAPPAPSGSAPTPTPEQPTPAAPADPATTPDPVVTPEPSPAPSQNPPAQQPPSAEPAAPPSSEPAPSPPTQGEQKKDDGGAFNILSLAVLFITALWATRRRQYADRT